jgi:hypothetical protein
VLRVAVAGIEMTSSGEGTTQGWVARRAVTTVSSAGATF